MSRYGEFGGPNKLIEGYIAWRDDRLGKIEDGLLEADSKADFPEFLYGSVRTAVWQGYQKIEPVFERYVGSENAPDFRERRMRGLNGLKGFGYVGDHGEYPGMRRTERPSAALVIDTYGGEYSITRQAIINDDTGELLNRNPSDLGFAAKNYLAEAVAALVESNPTAADGSPFFSVGRGNQGTAALSEDALADAIQALETQRDDDGFRIQFRTGVILVPNMRMELIARRILNSTLAATTANYTAAAGVGSAIFDKGTMNPLEGILPADAIVRDNFLTDQNDWYLFVNPDVTPAFVVGYLNGQKQPDVLIKNPEARSALGAGVDPYTFELDSVDFKVRFDFGMASVDPRGAYKSVVT